MKNDLASNIRTFRKEKGLTQEQLAEVFGVTVGAVHKWEAGLSTPDLSFIIRMADFFDTSLDVLIGFEPRDNRVSVLAERLRRMSYAMDPEGLTEAEKALKKYPHDFSIVFECALLYGVCGINPKNDRYIKRSEELFEQAVTLISQNTDPSINETVIYGQLAVLCQAAGDTQRALQIYKEHNAGGMFDITIGQILAQRGEHEEADLYLSRAIVKQLGDRIKLVTGKVMCYLKTGEYEEAAALIEAALKDNASYRIDGKPNVLDKYDCIFLTELACAELRSGNRKKAEKSLRKAIETASRFDTDPDYDVRNLRFISMSDSLMLHDTLGGTCMEAAEIMIRNLKDKELSELWRSLQDAK